MASAPARTATRGSPDTAARALMAGYASYRRARSQDGPSTPCTCSWTGRRSRSRARSLGRVEPTAGRRPARVGRGMSVVDRPYSSSSRERSAARSAARRSSTTRFPARCAAADPATRLARSGSGPDEGASWVPVDAPIARRSAALPARPRPSSGSASRKSGASERRSAPAGRGDPAERDGPAYGPPPVAHGGGAAQSRRGLRCGS